jgi:peptidoglycan/LPS O-acetylase OafA/YrhL
MSPSSPLFPFIIYIIAYLTGYLIYSKYKFNTTSGRYQTIDALRGFLALGVFIHHAHIWYFFIQTNYWSIPTSYAYSQLGQTSVALFFMITSFLFVSKLIQSREKPFDWVYFFTSRICRLVPMYYVSLLLLVLIVMQVSHWKLNVSIGEFLASLFHLAAFTITTSPMINASEETFRINSGVIWSLPFEWLFYFSLPIISLFLLKVKPSKFILGISFLFILFFTIANGVKIHHLISFGGGAVAPFLMKFPWIIKIAKSHYCSVVAIACLFVISLFPTSDKIGCKLAIITLFNIIALGNSVFGILKNNILKFLGEMAYSTYLLHGLLLFTVIQLGIGLEKIKGYTAFEYSLLIFSITPIVVLISFFGFKYVEKPFMNQSKKISRYFQPNK